MIKSKYLGPRYWNHHIEPPREHPGKASNSVIWASIVEGGSIGLHLLSQRIGFHDLLLQLSQILMKSRVLPLHSFAFLLPSVPFLGGISKNQDISSASSDEGEQRGSHVYDMGD
ncbi:unnamed protein product [Vicia faba]|uniref:Uncharacterized protein n=1 Tax=Vicia faba TaxID=3906 RepID=A0AAV0ZRZ1_VICFA|nr:unnamed protein product [Vicia faba]